jgi:hypothetical protein
LIIEEVLTGGAFQWGQRREEIAENEYQKSQNEQQAENYNEQR